METYNKDAIGDIHELKVLPGYFMALIGDRKTFEVRKIKEILRGIKMKIKRISMLVALLMVMMVVLIQPTYASEVKVIINQERLEFDVPPIIDEGRVLVPLRAIFEKLGSTDVGWDNETRTVKASVGNTEIKLQVDSKLAYINEISTELDVPAKIIKGRTLVPIRFITEAVGKEVTWDGKNRVVYIDDIIKDIIKEDTIINKSIGKGFSIGTTKKDIIEKFGEPDRVDKSEQGYNWFIYNKDLKNYFQVGLRKNKVVAFGTNSLNWEVDRIKIGDSSKRLKEVRKDLPELNNSNAHMLRENGSIVYIIVDIHENNSVSTIFITDKEWYDGREYTEEVNKGLALQLHDLVNVYRLRNNLNILKRDDKLVDLAKYHSKDMAKTGKFSHSSSNGDDLSVRSKKILGTEYGIGENISMGHLNSLESSSSLYNSLGHRNNILEKRYTLSGTAVEYRRENKSPYYTHNFQVEY